MTGEMMSDGNSVECLQVNDEVVTEKVKIRVHLRVLVRYWKCGEDL